MNPVRGEAEAKIGDVTVTMAITMQSLASLSNAVGSATLQELYQRLIGVEPFTAMAALQYFVFKGVSADGKPLKAKEAQAAAVAAFTLSDTAELQGAMAKLLGALTRDKPAEPESPNE